MQIEFPLWKCIANCKNSDRTPRRQTINTCKKPNEPREQPKSALYLRFKKLEVFRNVKGGPFGLFAKTPVCCKIRKKLNGDPLETLKSEKNEIRNIQYQTRLKGPPFSFFRHCETFFEKISSSKGPPFNFFDAW